MITSEVADRRDGSFSEPEETVNARREIQLYKAMLLEETDQKARQALGDLIEELESRLRPND